MRKQFCVSLITVVLIISMLCIFVHPVHAQETEDPAIYDEEYEIPIEEEQSPTPQPQETVTPLPRDEIQNIPPPQTMNASALWNIGTGRVLLSSAITSDGSFLVVGTHRSGVAYMINRKGEILWEKKEQVPVYGVAISPEGSHVAVATDRLELLYPSGNTQWTLDTGFFIYSVDLSSNAEYIVIGSDDDRISLKDREGTNLWEYQVGDSVYSVSISDNGSAVAAGSDDSRVYFLDQNGELLWSYTAGNAVRSVALSGDGNYVVAGSYDRIVYFFDRTGLLLWKYTMGERVNSVTISPDGDYIAASAGAKTKVFDHWGRMLWEFDTMDMGNYVGISSEGTLIGTEITTVAFSQSARYMVLGTGSGDQKVYLYSIHASSPVPVNELPDPHLPPQLSELQSFLHSAEQSGMEVSPDAYIVSITNARSMEANVSVQIAVPPQWANSSANKTVAIVMWKDDTEPVPLTTTYTGLDLKGNPVYEATAPPGMNATFGAALVSTVPGPGIGEQFMMLMVPGAVVACAALVTGGVLMMRRQSRKKKQHTITEEEELRSVHESLKGIKEK